MDSLTPIVEALVVEQDINNPDAITFIDSKLYKAAAKGQIDPFNSYTEPLHLLLTPTKNTILHIHITQQPKGANVSISFTEQILAKCPSLLLQTNNRGETPLHMAARHGHKDIVKLLIDSAKATHQDVETGAGAARTMLRMESTDKETALHEAVRHNNPTVVQILTEEDPDFTYSANRLGETPLYLAVERQYTKIAVQILNTCSSPDFCGPIGRTALHEAVIRNSSETIAKIVQVEETLVKVADQKGWTPLHHASYLGRLSIVKQLLECDKSVAYISDKDGLTPLHLAAARGNKAVVYSMLENCPDCHELTDNKGRNVLHFAVQSKEVSLLDCSVQGANCSHHYQPLLTNLINQKDVNGNTPVHLLATYCISNKALVKHPFVDTMAVNNNNFTPLDVVLNTTDSHDEGLKGITLRCMKKANGYKTGSRNFIAFEDRPPKPIDVAHMEKTKTSHMIVAALVATVTFTAGFTIPGGYDSNRGTAILSKKRAFASFAITNTWAFLLSTCALFFHYNMDMEVDNRRKWKLLKCSALFIRLSIILMVFAFSTAFSLVIDSHVRFEVSFCSTFGLFVLIYYYPMKYLYDNGRSSHSTNVYENL